MQPRLLFVSISMVLYYVRKGSFYREFFWGLASYIDYFFTLLELIIFSNFLLSSDQ
jgi:hypothetical protein